MPLQPKNSPLGAFLKALRGKLNRRIVFSIAALVLFAAAATALFWSTTASRAGSGRVDVTFLDYTKNPAGSNAVSFVISNASPKTVTIANYFFMCPRDQSWDVASERRVVLASGKSARLVLEKAKGDCTLLVLYQGYSWREAVRSWSARTHIWQLFPRCKWGLPAKYEQATIQVPDSRGK